MICPCTVGRGLTLVDPLSCSLLTDDSPALADLDHRFLAQLLGSNEVLYEKSGFFFPLFLCFL